MRLAVLSDIHSNIFALEAVIRDAENRDAETMLNLGDTLYGPIAPRETYDLLMERPLITIRGNQDRQIFDATEAEIESNPTMQFILKDLGEEPLDWMQSLPFDLQLTQEVYLCHGTPADDRVYLLENVESGVAQLRADSEILELLHGQKSDLVLCGHTHTARAVHTSSNQLIVNPGSVGLPAYTDDEPCPHSMESYSPHASYAIVECGADGWFAQHIKVPYDCKRAAKQALQQNRPDWAHFLATGRRL